MNKKIIIIAIFTAGFFPLHAQNQSSTLTTWGLTAGTNLSSFIISGTSDVSSKMKSGVSLGGFVNFECTNHLALQTGLTFQHKTSGIDRNDLPGKFQYWGVEIPVFAVYQYKFQNGGRTCVGLGPYAEFGFDARLKRNGEKIDLYEKNRETELSAMKDSDLGFGMMFGYEFPCGIQINAGYKLGVVNILDANSSAFKMLPQTVSLGIGYHFGK
jgi:hypothetical protein